MAESSEKPGNNIVPLLEKRLPQHVMAGYMRYEKIRSLGRGGKAEVFLCRDQLLGREVAVKVLHPDLLSCPEEQHMLVREARIMAALSLAGIPTIHDLGRDFESRPYFAMTFVPGETLREMLQRAKSVDGFFAQQYELQQRLNVLIGISEILQAAHEMQVVHGDLKPENVMIEPSGGVHLIDWGLATLLQEVEGDDCPDQFARERGLQGSPLYMTPEQTCPGSAITTATDIYALGTLLYECLTLAVPFQGVDVNDVLSKIATSEPIAPRKRAANRFIPAQLERLCLQSLSKDPGARQSTISEFVADLRECQLDLLCDYEREEIPRSVSFGKGELVWSSEAALAYV
jgi:eukaryotic-like serine/threonine-protein kinase